MYSNIKIDNISIRLNAKMTAIKLMVTLIMKESVRIAITIKTKKKQSQQK